MSSGSFFLYIGLMHPSLSLALAFVPWVSMSRNIFVKISTILHFRLSGWFGVEDLNWSSIDFHNSIGIPSRPGALSLGADPPLPGG